MNILITGATGFIGKALCHALIEQGHNLYVISRKPDQVNRILGCTVIASADPFCWLDIPMDAVINLAGAPIADARWSEHRKELLINSRIGPTRQLISYIEQCSHKPEVLISGSAIGIYGAHGDDDVREDSHCNDDFAHRLCQLWEAEAMAAETYGVRVCILRTGLVLGRDGGMLSRLLTPFRLGLGGHIGSGLQYMPWIHRQDLLRIITFLIDRKDLSGAFNGTAPVPVRNNTFSRILGAELKRPVLLPVPGIVLRLALGEMSQLMLRGAKVIPWRLQENGFEFEYSTLRPALQEIL
ncbi:TIGR01777 family oxidoreductase [Oceanospirillum sediminis]|uniref:TIGR01777 family protein n=1 Tax=Oceanospirillum sediminis TaxID=2760088 RepID=A0A839IV14_9GAMM|nr:TIGR01777 family oxidoreductase [Oceanospirillum sediminis]MBB1488798.1 TIGR01777 family protein [Oceanospirillum sediminis]